MMKIALTGIFVKGPNAAFEFYTRVLGFVERTHVPEADLAIVASPEDPTGTGLLLEPGDKSIGKTFLENPSWQWNWDRNSIV